MKKLFTAITSLSIVAVSASTLTSCATTLLKNTYSIDFSDNTSSNKINYKYNKVNGEFEIDSEAYTSNNKETNANNLKLSTNGSANYANTFFEDMLNVLFFNANTSITNNGKSLKAQQYVFETDSKGIYVDGQYRTAGYETEKSSDYYKSYDESKKGIASILGLAQYNEYKNGQSENSQESTTIPTISKDSIDLIKQMYNSSNNQGIKSVTINSTPTPIDGKIALADEDNKFQDFDTPYTSRSKSNFSYSDEEESKLTTYVAGTSSSQAYDPYAITLISSLNDSESNPVKFKNIDIVNVDAEKDFTNHTNESGIIINKQNSIKYEYKWTTTGTGDDAKKTFSSKTYGFNLVKLAPIEATIVFNDDIKLNKKPNADTDYKGNEYTIKVKIDNLYAYFTPVLSVISNTSKDSSNNNRIYLGWSLGGYQFNNTNILGYDENGKTLTKSDVSNSDKTLPLWKNKFNNMSIIDFSIEKTKDKK